MTEITVDIAKKVLATVDAGLVKGMGRPVPGQMCVEAAVCYAMDLPHSDDPVCVSRALRQLKIKMNDSDWSSNKTRTKGLRRLALAQLGSRDVLDDVEFVMHVAELSVRKSVPLALRAAASSQNYSSHKEALLLAADMCEKEGTKESALKAKVVVEKARMAQDLPPRQLLDAAYWAVYSAQSAASAVTLADGAYWSAHSATISDMAEDWASDAAYSAASAASTAAKAADSGRDKALADFCEDVVQILIEMKAPGCQWLFLTEE